MKNNKNKIKSLMILFLCIIIVIIYTIIRIYALFYSESMAKVQLKNGVWNIIVNGTDITKGENINFLIDNVSTFENEHVKPGNLAPGLTGFFKIGIDPQHTDVSIKYEISLNQEELTNSNIIIKSITETQEGNKLNKIRENTYVGIITLEKIKAGYKNEITVEIEWTGDESKNEEDMELGTKWDFKYEIPITVHVCQYFGEELNTYI